MFACRGAVLHAASRAPVCDDLVMTPTVAHRRRPPELSGLGTRRSGSRRLRDRRRGRGRRRCSRGRRRARSGGRAPRHPAPRHDGIRRLRTARTRTRNGTAPAVILVSSRDVADYGDLIGDSPRGGSSPRPSSRARRSWRCSLEPAHARARHCASRRRDRSQRGLDRHRRARPVVGDHGPAVHRVRRLRHQRTRRTRATAGEPHRRLPGRNGLHGRSACSRW